MRQTPNLDLTVWDNNSDEFNPTELADNWDKIDAANAVVEDSVQIEIVSTVPSVDNFAGRTVYLTAADSGFAAKRLLGHNGTAWRDLGTPEEFASLPTVGNYHGRLVMLTSASGGFAADSLVVNINGASTWKKIGGIPFGSTLPVAPSAGDTFLLTAAAGGFESYTLVAYNGSDWIRTEKRGVNTGTTLPGSPYNGQLFVLTAAASGFKAYDLVQYTGSAWRLITGPTFLTMSQFLALTSVPDGYEVYLRVDEALGINWHLRYNSSSASSYKWEVLGSSDIFSEVTTQQSPGTAKTWVDMSTVGPSWTVPTGIGGDFVFEARATQTPNDKVPWRIGLSVNNVDPVTRATAYYDGYAVEPNTLVLNKCKITSLASADVVKLRYWVFKVDPLIGSRVLVVTPVRIGVV